MCDFLPYYIFGCTLLRHTTSDFSFFRTQKRILINSVVLRETSLVVLLFVVHLGLALAFFITMPVGKFVHGIYRYIALVRHVQEQARSADDH